MTPTSINGGSVASDHLTFFSRIKSDSDELMQMEITIPQEIYTVRVVEIFFSRDDFSLTWLELFRKYKPLLFEFLNKWDGEYEVRAKKMGYGTLTWFLKDAIRGYFKVFTEPAPVYYATLVKLTRTVGPASPRSAVIKSPRPGPSRSRYGRQLASPTPGSSGTRGTAVKGQRAKVLKKFPASALKKPGTWSTPYSRRKSIPKKRVTFSPDLPDSEEDLDDLWEPKTPPFSPDVVSRSDFVDSSPAVSRKRHCEMLPSDPEDSDSKGLIKRYFLINFFEYLDGLEKQRKDLSEVRHEILELLMTGEYSEVTALMPKTSAMLKKVFGIS